jgi:DNA-binding PadR family transcriptional regulator
MPREKLTTPDLVLLSLLAERPMHGYEANLLLEARKVRDWAGVSRPQVYYSLDKLARLGMIEGAEATGEKVGPDRRVFATSEAGKSALADALEREEWTQHSERPPFLTWLALSWKCRPGVFKRQLQRRREFVRGELQRKQRVIEDVLAEVGHPFHEAVWMLSFSLEQLRTELTWLDQVAREFPRCAAARNPVYDLATTDL